MPVAELAEAKNPNFDKLSYRVPHCNGRPGVLALFVQKIGASTSLLIIGFF
jgi:hypothetical protein